nr:50S ribosomal protein L13, chloroplastic-like isoform X2 [Tanacetum cinerariifolium]
MATFAGSNRCVFRFFDKALSIFGLSFHSGVLLFADLINVLKPGWTWAGQSVELVPVKKIASSLRGKDVDSNVRNKTWYPKAEDHVNTEKTWHVVDASDKILGRLASTIALHIHGKNLATYTPSVDMGAFVIVVNADKVAVSGKKRTQKLYRRHSGRPGGMTVETFDQLQQRIPETIVEHATIWQDSNMLLWLGFIS